MVITVVMDRPVGQEDVQHESKNEIEDEKREIHDEEGNGGSSRKEEYEKPPPVAEDAGGGNSLKEEWDPVRNVYIMPLKNEQQPDKRSTTLSLRPTTSSFVSRDKEGNMELGLWGNASRGLFRPTGQGRVSARFVYPADHRGKREIRLIEIMPEMTVQSGDGIAGAVYCRMKTVALDDAPEFWALSYAWGDASRRKTVFMGGYTVQVGESLEHFLQELRMQRFGHVQLWADAVCMYSNRSSIKHLRNLRFKPLFCEGVD
jgi:Heterokaryon incompatibility protein (HET)